MLTMFFKALERLAFKVQSVDPESAFFGDATICMTPVNFARARGKRDGPGHHCPGFKKE